ncbi:MAG: hypothetical protein OFPII_09640 [Osedax symbiont Rs1]|nr:MAG: hypothetical protein OFPII_09640 [Osedax symbiont Rs1]
MFSQIDLSAVNENPSRLADSLLLMSALNLLIMPIYWGATIVYMQSTVNGPAFTPGQAIVASIQLWPKLFLVFLLSSGCIFFGLMAFIIPGLYIAIRLSVADYICVVEKDKVLTSLKQSWHITQNYVWLIFRGIAIIVAVIFVLKSVLIAVLNNFIDTDSILTFINIVFDLLSVTIMIYGFRIYCLIKAEL